MNQIVSDGSNNILSNIELTRTSNQLEQVHLLVIELEHPILGFNDRTSNIEPNWAFTRFTEFLIEQTRTSFFQTLKKLEHVHLLVIKLKHQFIKAEKSLL